MTTLGEQFNKLVEAAMSLEQTEPGLSEDIQTAKESAKSQDSFQDNEAIRKKYTTTRIKSRNLLSNIAYVGISKEDYYNENFAFDVYLLLTKSLNPFSLDRKLADKTKHEMIYMLWKEQIPTRFYRHICKEQNFLYLTRKNVLQPKVVEIITDFIKEDKNNYKQLRNNLSSQKSIFQYVYSNVFPEIYCATEKKGFDLKNIFHIIFKTYKDKKRWETSLGKNPENYETMRNETNIYQQKPININEFYHVEESEVRARVEKRKEKRREVAEKNKLLKKKKRREQFKENEEVYWKRLGELNKQFKAKKKAKQMSETTIEM